MTDTPQPSPPNRLKRWARELLILVVIFAVAGTALDYYRLYQRDESRLTPQIMQALLQHATTAKDRKQVEEQDKPLLIYVWASWCGVCKLTSRAVSNIAQDYPVATVALKSGTQNTVNQWLNDNDYRFVALADNTGALSQTLDVSATPAFLIVSPQGDIRYFSIGVNTEPALRLKLSLFDSSQ